MLSKTMEAALNGQLNAELYSGYLYLSMSAYFESAELPGFAHWMRAQAEEEQSHAMKLYRHIAERRGRVLLEAIEQPPTEWESPLAAFEAVLAHEKKVTGMIDRLVETARGERDDTAVAFLQWFVKEQVEEEASAGGVLQRLKAAGKQAGALSELDDDLGRRGAD